MKGLTHGIDVISTRFGEIDGKMEHAKVRLFCFASTARPRDTMAHRARPLTPLSLASPPPQKIQADKVLGKFAEFMRQHMLRVCPNVILQRRKSIVLGVYVAHGKRVGVVVKVLPNTASENLAVLEQPRANVNNQVEKIAMGVELDHFAPKANTIFIVHF